MRALIVIALVVLSGIAGCSGRAEPPGCGADYGSCETSAQCGGGATCERFDWDYGAGNVCTQACDDELDCPRAVGRHGRCIDVNRSGRFQCHQACATTSECPTGWVCQPVRSDSGVSGVCLP